MSFHCCDHIIEASTVCSIPFNDVLLTHLDAVRENILWKCQFSPVLATTRIHPGSWRRGSAFILEVGHTHKHVPVHKRHNWSNSKSQYGAKGGAMHFMQPVEEGHQQPWSNHMENVDNMSSIIQLSWSVSWPPLIWESCHFPGNLEFQVPQPTSVVHSGVFKSHRHRNSWHYHRWFQKRWQSHDEINCTGTTHHHSLPKMTYSQCWDTSIPPEQHKSPSTVSTYLPPDQPCPCFDHHKPQQFQNRSLSCNKHEWSTQTTDSTKTNCLALSWTRTRSNTTNTPGRSVYHSHSYNRRCNTTAAHEASNKWESLNYLVTHSTHLPPAAAASAVNKTTKSTTKLGIKQNPILVRSNLKTYAANSSAFPNPMAKWRTNSRATMSHMMPGSSHSLVLTPCAASGSHLQALQPDFGHL